MHVSLKNKKNTTLEHIDNFVDGAAVKRVGEISFNLSYWSVRQSFL
jgi:threonine dehydratase